jgi:hypothetical protein
VTAVFVPVWLLVVAGLLLLVVLPWALCAAAGRNLLPFPDPGSRIFAATSPAAADAIVTIMERHGCRQRFWGITPGVRRAILWDGTLVTSPAPWATTRGPPRRPPPATCGIGASRHGSSPTPSPRSPSSSW